MVELKDGQLKARQEIEESLFGARPRNHVLMGYAGTGKSFLVSQIFDHRADLASIPFCAPTNKAAKVLREMGLQNVCTVYQLLCLAVDKGKLIQHSQPDFSEYKAIVIDECSMLNAFVMSLLEKHVPKNVPILFVGDPYQLPPVKESDSKSFLTPNKSILKEVVRQAAGNPIIKYSMAIREHGFSTKGIPFDGKHIIHVPKNQAYSAALAIYKRGGVTAAWTNKAVGMINQNLHAKIYGEDATDYCVGEKVILQEPLVDIFDDSQILATNGDEMVVKEIAAMQYKGFMAWRIETDCFNTIYAIQEGSRKEYEAELKRLAELKGDRMRQYWKLKESLTEIRLPYAVTCHKLQGSTFNQVLVVAEDIADNWVTRGRDSCGYVAVTRASDKLYIIQ